MKLAKFTVYPYTKYKFAHDLELLTIIKREMLHLTNVGIELDGRQSVGVGQ